MDPIYQPMTTPKPMSEERLGELEEMFHPDQGEGEFWQAPVVRELVAEVRLQRDRLAAELAEANERIQRQLTLGQEMDGKFYAAQAELAEVREYAGHHSDCRGLYGKCTCGWSAMRERHAKGKT